MGRHHDDDGDGVADFAQRGQVPEQDDLTGDDHLVQNTEKHAPDDPDADLPVPPQDPDVVLDSAVDVDGQPT